MSDRRIFAHCVHCEEPIYKRSTTVPLGKPRHCGKTECKSAFYKSENNPFWGKSHSSETKAKIASAKIGRPSGAKGVTKRPLTLKEKQKRSETMKLEWSKNRDRRLACLTRGEDHHWKKPHEEIRHRLRFTEFQRREWTGKSCLWCDSTEDLVLDHILPIAAGGKCVRENAQTLCQPCNLWKMWYVDRPLAVYAKATSGAR